MITPKRNLQIILLFSILVTFSLFTFVLPFQVFAQATATPSVDPDAGLIIDDPDASSLIIENPIESNTLTELLEVALRTAIKIGFPFLVLAIIYCGFLFVMAQGKPEDIKKAWDALLYTLIGAGVLLGSWGLAEVISSTIESL